MRNVTKDTVTDAFMAYMAADTDPRQGFGDMAP